MNDAAGNGERGAWARRVFLGGVNLIPLGLRRRALETLAEWACAVDGRHRRIAARNLSIAFPELSPEEKKRLVRAVFRNLGRVFAELFFISRLTPANVNRYIFMEGLENLEKAVGKGKGVLFLTAHFGNWEWMAAAFPLISGRNSSVVVRPLDNGFLNGVVDSLRTRTGNHTIPKQKGMGRILRVLKQGGIAGILLDQNMDWREGVFVDFFGEAACTNTGVALLALKTGAAVLPIFNIRQADGRYRVVIEPEVELFRSGDRDRDVQANTEIFTKIIERYIRNYPDQWLWVHQRWKTRPWQVKTQTFTTEGAENAELNT